MATSPDELDESWRLTAERTRQALGLLGHDIKPQCLPGEPDAGDCGGTNAEHALAHLLLLSETAEHEINHHLKPPGDTLAMVRASVRAEVVSACRLVRRGK